MGAFRYNNGNYKKYHSKNFLKRWMIKRLNKKILELLNQSIEDLSLERIKILDAGCGEGFISNLIYSCIPNVEIVGLEYTREALEIARKNNKNITYMQGDIYEMPFAENSFDIVICTEVLEHLDKPESALKELKRTAKSRLILTVPNEPWFCMGNLLVLKNVSHLGNPADHINHWTYTEFKEFVHTYFNNAIYDTSFPWSIAYCEMENGDEKYE